MQGQEQSLQHERPTGELQNEHRPTRPSLSFWTDNSVLVQLLQPASTLSQIALELSGSTGSVMSTTIHRISTMHSFRAVISQLVL